MHLSTCRQTLLSRGLALWHTQPWVAPGKAHDTVFQLAKPLLCNRKFVPFANSILPAWAADYALEVQINKVQSVQVLSTK